MPAAETEEPIASSTCKRPWPPAEDLQLCEEHKAALRELLKRLGLPYAIENGAYPLITKFVVTFTNGVEVDIWPSPCVWGKMTEYYWGVFERDPTTLHVSGRLYPYPDTDTDAINANLDDLETHLVALQKLFATAARPGALDPLDDHFEALRGLFLNRDFEREEDFREDVEQHITALRALFTAGGGEEKA